jgi:hypothetical protein
LLSLALFAVVGGALAFKAKFSDTFCTTNAYFNAAGVYYCSFKPAGLPITTTTCGPVPVPFITIDPALGAIKKVCTTNVDPVLNCNTTCPVLTTTKPN